MKVAIFSDTFVPQVNGVAKTIKRLIDHFEQQGIDYQLFVPDALEQSDLFSSNIHSFVSLPFFLYPECRMALPNLFSIKEKIEAFKPDLIHIATPFNIGLTGLHFGKKYQIPMVGSYHTHFDYYLRYYKLTFMTEMLWKYMKWFHTPFEKTFVPSEETKDYLADKGFQNIELWTRGVDCQLFHPRYDKESVRKQYSISRKYTLLYVGRMAPEKDLETLRHIMRLLPKNIQDEVHWLLVGDGPLRAEMMEEYQEHVTFTGYLKGEALASVYTCADLFVFPSSSETFGNVVLEALASGTPAIVADQGGVKEIVQHRKTGLICEAKNPHSFSNAIVSLLTNHSIRKEMGYEAREYAKSQSWDTIFAQLVKQYELVAQKQKNLRQLA
ncbi:glycosyltransferase family 4 protein [Halalkalibacter urbisdiaboli]|uniref:glycosyltransferase family 4 protein n=1 Tax=Halalkalibacter urbisdiaboli TaxID=1960589 RepID=UPI000B450A95|nr:glycosyltransferase family 1 protein [Halalkalibacter urbisdiaboli]